MAEYGYLADSGERYRIVRQLTEAGGFASVAVAEDGSGRLVALKSLRWRGLSADLLYAEAEFLRAVRHDNVVRFRDVGSNPVPFLAMELADEPSLQARIDAAGAAGRVVPLSTLLDWAGQLLRGLRAIHQQLGVHRDLRPRNILFGGGTVKIADLGSAQRWGTLRATGILMATPGYSPPEAWLGTDEQPASAGYDFYSLGVILFTLATLRPPFPGSPDEQRLHHLLRLPPDPARLRPDLPPELAALILRMLRKNPADRGADADEHLAVIDRLRR